MTNKYTVIICDDERVNFNHKLVKVYSFSSYKTDGLKIYSLPHLLDIHSDEIRIAVLNDRLDFIKFTKFFLNKTSCFEGLLYWMSLPVEVSILKCKELKDLLLLKAFELHFNSSAKDTVKKIQYEGSNKNIAIYLKLIARQNSIEFNWKRPLIFKMEKIYRIFTEIKSCLIYMAWRANQIQLNLKKINHATEGAEIFFLSYLLNYKIEKKFIILEPNYWGELPNSIVNWTNKSLNYVMMETQGGKILSDDLTFSNGIEIHRIESAINLSLYLRVIFLWIKLIPYWIAFKKNVEKNIPTDQMGYWTITKRLWRNSLIGKCGLENIFFIELFDKFLKNIPKQKYGFYLMENQGWERAFVESWKKNGHGKLVGVAHSTVRYWDLRNYDENISNILIAGIFLPRPDYVTINGKAGIFQLNKMGQLSKRYIEVEALRYQYLCDHIEKTESNMKRVLLFSDYRLEKTLGIIKKIENILDKKKYRLSLKLHPMINEKDFTLANKLNIKLEHSLGAALANSDLVVGSSYTSSLLDAYCLGWPIITILDGDEVDSSPFKGLDYNFANKINSVNELITKLESLCFIQQKNKIDNFFCLDKELKKWNQLIRDLELG